MNIEQKKMSAVILSSVILTLPLVGFAAVGIPCDGPNCGFNDLITLANNVIKFLMFTVAVPLAAVGFAWAGAGLVLNQNKEGAWSDAKERFTDIAKGFGIILVAFLLVKLILSAFLGQGYTLYLFQ